MKLFLRHKNQLFDAIEDMGLSPSLFKYEEDKDNHGNVTSTWITFQGSEFGFFIYKGSNNTQFARVTPGEFEWIEYREFSDWEDLLMFFNDWLEAVKQEINAIDKWERLEKELHEISLNFSNEQDKFTVQEFEQVRIKIIAFKTGLSSIGLEPSQLEIINQKLDHITELAKEMNKFDWKGLFIGSIVSIIIQLSLTPENANSIWHLLRQVFASYILP